MTLDEQKSLLLERKIKFLEYGINLRDRYIHQLHLEVRGQPYPVDEFIKADHYLNILAKHEKELHTIGLELENIALKEKAEVEYLIEESNG